MKQTVKYLVFYVIILSVQQKRYHVWYPSLPLYPDNTKDVAVVEQYSQQNNQEQYRFFKLTDASVSAAFTFVGLPEETLINIQSEQNHLILGLKYLFNRARPYQISNSVVRHHSNTDKTPAFPSGHAFQAYYLASKLTHLYPQLREQLWKTAEKCAICRVYAGLHYTSDNLFSKMLVKQFYIQ